MSRQGLGIVAVAAGVVASSVAIAVSSTAPAAAEEALRPFRGCEQLSDWYADAAMPRVTAWGLGDSWLDAARSGDVVAAAEAAAPEDAVGSGDTGTNIQEAGVDEPDVAKTDGRHVVTVRHGRLQVFDVTGDSPRRLGSVALTGETDTNELLLVGDRAVVLGARYEQPWTERGADDGVRSWPVPTRFRTTITTVDLSDPSSPEVVEVETVDGGLVSAREYDGVVRVVVSSTPDLPFVTPGGVVSEWAALARNRQIVREADAQDWLPKRGNGAPLLSCSDVRHPEPKSGLGTLSVITFEPGDPAALDTVGVSADGDLVYSSSDRLYVATTAGGWVPLDDVGPRREPGRREPGRQGVRTQVHAFELSGARTSYSASGSVEGIVHDRWAFSELDGRLRVATMLGEPWQPAENAISVLEERGRRLVVVGSVAGMGRNEQIRAVRWFGDLAVMVTFRQTDPLYTVDLSDPRRPRVLGELKIPGFSAYLHPLGDGRLLGVGQDATLAGQQLGAQVSTFDLGRLDDPRRLDTLGLGRHTESDVEQDSRAFTYLPDRRLAFVPVTDWFDGSTSMQVIGIGETGELRLVDTVPMRFGRMRFGYDSSTRALPLDDGQVAVTADGRVAHILDI
jgi:uncharacterized secreted protein with C-terminal beta-propeller domain